MNRQIFLLYLVLILSAAVGLVQIPHPSFRMQNVALGPKNKVGLRTVNLSPDRMTVLQKASSRRALGQKCEALSYYVFRSDVQHALITNNQTNTIAYAVNLYSKKTGKISVGQWNEVIHGTKVHQNVGGVGSIAITLNKSTSLSFASVVGQNQQTLTGGSGAYAVCPGGYVQLARETIDKFYFDVLVCNTCA